MTTIFSLFWDKKWLKINKAFINLLMTSHFVAFRKRSACALKISSSNMITRTSRKMISWIRRKKSSWTWTLKSSSDHGSTQDYFKRMILKKKSSSLKISRKCSGETRGRRVGRAFPSVSNWWNTSCNIDRECRFYTVEVPQVQGTDNADTEKPLTSKWPETQSNITSFFKWNFRILNNNWKKVALKWIFLGWQILGILRKSGLKRVGLKSASHCNS